jgi:hypothetical protein
MMANIDGILCIVTDIESFDGDPDSCLGYGLRFKLDDGSSIDVQSEYDHVEVF